MDALFIKRGENVFEEGCVVVGSSGDARQLFGQRLKAGQKEQRRKGSGGSAARESKRNGDGAIGAALPGHWSFVPHVRLQNFVCERIRP